MRIGCLQFAPQVGDVDNNLNRADAALNRSEPDDLDLLVLPELAFSGYSFKSLQEISPFLEPSGSGITSLWTRTVALKYDCTVITGYPEKVDPTLKWPTGPEYYNAAIVVNGDGETIANYRKDHLHFTDERWALEGSGGFYQGFLPGLGPTSIGIGMDLDPYHLQTPWHKFEFAHHVLDSETRLVIVSMAWITQEDARSFSRMPQEPDMATLTYWISRLEPIIRAESDEEVIVVFANRTGTEGDITYAGTSAVVGIRSGEVYLYGILGRGDKDLLVVDTDAPPYAKLIYRPHARDHVDSKDHGPPKDGNVDSQDINRSEGTGKHEPGTQLPAKNASTSPSLSDSRRPPKSSYRRNDLHIAVPADADDKSNSKAPSVHTPTAPSPTPHSIRPRLPIPPAPSMTQRYLDSHASSPYFEPSNVGTPGYILGGEVMFDASCPPSATSATYASESRFSESSLESPQMYWTPYTQAQIPPPLSRLAGSSSDGQLHTELGSVPTRDERMEEEKRISIRSDVSVWNNHQGRPPSITAIPIATEQSMLDGKGAGADLPVPSRSSIVHAKDHHLPKRPSSPKSRHASRSRGLERSSSMAGIGSDIGIVQKNLEDVALRAESAQTNQSRSYTPNDRRSSYRQDDNGKRHSSTGIQSSIPVRTLSRMSIPIAMDSSLWNTIGQQYEEPRAASAVKSSEPPVLEPFSRERIQFMSEVGHGHNREPSRTEIEVSEHGSARHSPHSICDEDGGNRGRQPFASVGSRVPSSHLHSSDKHQGSVTANNQRDLIDLSKFALIEEYPSPHCPVHGQRSRTGTKQDSMERTAHLEDRHRSSSICILTTSAKTSPSVSGSSKFSRQSASRNPLDGPPYSSNETSQVSFLSIAGSHREPKTPKAMKFTHDSLVESTGTTATLSLTQSSATSLRLISQRPRSCVW